MNISNQSSTQDSGQSPYQWDHYSDQPYPIRDKKLKRSLRVKALPANVKMLFINIFAVPSVLYRFFVLNRFNLQQRLDEKIGLCINLDKEPELTEELVRELGVKKISIRIPLADVENISLYKEFAKRFMDLDVLFVVLQDKEHIDNVKILEEDITTIFSTLSSVSNKFQIGNAINRTKWGFISVEEYLDFFRIIQKIRDEQFQHLELFGSSVIDFEVHTLIRSLWHRYPITYDGVSAQLYVDRRGAPENKQFSFDLVSKINFFSAVLLSSSKSFKRLLITEANWPIKDTKPYAPALGDVWVDEDDYANYMARYYLLALANANAECVYWHQLVAPGYGLIDNREGQIRKRRAFYMYQFLIRCCKGARILEVVENGSSYQFDLKNYANESFSILWSVSGSYSKRLPSNVDAFDAVGELLAKAGASVEIAQEPVYLFERAKQKTAI